MQAQRLPQEQILREDIELGEEITGVEVKQPVGLVVSVRLSSIEADQLERIAEKSGKSIVEVAREAILAALEAGASPQTDASTPLRTV